MVHLKALMVLNRDTTASLARYLGISRQTLSSRMNGKSSFKCEEIMRICEKYSLDSEDLVTIFF